MSLVDAHTDIEEVAPIARVRSTDTALVSHTRHQIVDVVDLALDLLPEQQRIVVLLHDMRGLSADEVCSTLRLPMDKQRALLHCGRAALRASLDHCAS
jgi:RNA polymerase sigma-70 factor (ECF subfamily)